MVDKLLLRVVAFFALGILLLLLLQTTAGRRTRTLAAPPTPTLSPTPSNRLFMPAISGQQSGEARAEWGLFPAEWQPFLRSYGSLILLVLAVVAWGFLRWHRKRSQSCRGTS